jgi:hypothetical protein
LHGLCRFIFGNIFFLPVGTCALVPPPLCPRSQPHPVSEQPTASCLQKSHSLVEIQNSQPLLIYKKATVLLKLRTANRFSSTKKAKALLKLRTANRFSSTKTT